MCKSENITGSEINKHFTRHGLRNSMVCLLLLNLAIQTVISVYEPVVRAQSRWLDFISFKDKNMYYSILVFMKELNLRVSPNEHTCPKK